MSLTAAAPDEAIHYPDSDGQPRWDNTKQARWMMTLFGNLCVDVPEGVEAELTGFHVLGDRELRLASVPRRPGTPLIRVRAHGLLG